MLEGAHDVVERHEADRVPLLVEDGQAADTVAAHHVEGGLEGVFSAARVDLARHGVADVELSQGAAPRVGGHAEVAVGDHPDGATRGVDHRQDPAVVLPHEPCRLRVPVLGVAADDVRGHDVTDLHHRALSST